MAIGKAKQRIKRRKVTFSFKAIDATEVILMGDFNDWDPKKHPMNRNENGVWEKAIIIPPGRYEYKFMVDGRWREDPLNDQRCSNCYGTYNNIVTVTTK